MFISAIVVNYREEYIKRDKDIKRFILLVIIFVLSILLLTIRPNLVSILLGWDGLGLVSYALVIYYQNLKSFNAGILTALTNRIGDVALLISIAWITNFGRWNFIIYFEFIKTDKIIITITLFVVLAALTKRAQIPFSAWLPAAIAAPTPVSALVHSSTLVTAGVYLLIRFNGVFSTSILNILLFISLLTIFISGLAANFEFDLKKIIALSTLRQLGLIISILALGGWDLAFYHLLVHALFKALLFICAGIIIHNLGNCQDIRNIGNLVYMIPLTCSYFNICNFSLCGLPFLSGFYSKDLVVESLSIGYINLFVYWIFYLSVGLTVCYRFRLAYYTITGNYNFIRLNSLRERNKIILKSMGGLIFFVVVIGRTLSWLIFSTPYFICLPNIMKILTLVAILFGVWIGYELAKLKQNYLLKSLKFSTLTKFSVLMWNLPVLSTIGVNIYPNRLRSSYLSKLDCGWSEYYGRQNLYENIKKYSILSQLLSCNHVKIYFLLTFIWLIFLVIYLI